MIQPHTLKKLSQQVYLLTDRQTERQRLSYNKTCLHPVSRPVEQAQYFGVWVKDAKAHWCKGFADKQT